MTMNICMICLRTDKQTNNNINSLLANFHEEICENTLPPAHERSYCIQCEYLLRKHFKFQKQCVEATKIYQKWKKTKAENRPPIQFLTLLLKAPTLDFWQPNSHVVYVTLTSEPEHSTCIDVLSQAGEEKTAAKPIKQYKPTIKNKTAKSETKEIKIDKPDDRYSERLTVEESIHDKELLTNDEIKHELNENVFEDKENMATDTSIEELSLDNEDELGDDGEHFDKDVMMDDQKLTTDDKMDEHHQLEEDEDIIFLEISDNDFKSLEGINLKHVYSGDDNSQTEIDDDNDDFHTKRKKGADCSLIHSKKEKPFQTELIKLELAERLSSCGEIYAEDGTAIDKDMVIKHLFPKMTHHSLTTIRQVLRSGSKQQITRKIKEALNSVHIKLKEDEKFKTVFDIEYLSTYQMKLEEFEKRKTYKTYVNAAHKCDICYTPFRRAGDLKNHIKKRHEVGAENAGECCPICKVWPGKRTRQKTVHRKTHSAVYRCKLCPMVTYSRVAMMNHFERHGGKVYRCDPCNYSVNWKSAYFMHMIKFHPKQHVCTACGRGFHSPKVLKFHANTHKNEPAPAAAGSGAAVPCAKCGVQFPSQAVLDVHVADVHTQPAVRARGRPLNCTTSYENNLMRRKVQINVRPVKCNLCNKVRLGAAWLKSHYKREHPSEDWNFLFKTVNRHLCEICGCGFSSVYVLRDHMNLHTGARPYACDLCPKRFRSAVLMRDHRARHFPPTNLCTLCGKKFKTKSNLFNHMKIHLGEKTHKCEACAKSFLHSQALLEHVRGVHRRIRRVRRGGRDRVRELGADPSHLNI